MDKQSSKNEFLANLGKLLVEFKIRQAEREKEKSRLSNPGDGDGHCSASGEFKTA